MPCEAAEVFSLGWAMWMLLQEVPQGGCVEDPEEIIVSWSEDADDVPDHRKATVMRCLERDPNQMMRLADLVQCWEGEQQIWLS